jgi:hypothetical protein
VDDVAEAPAEDDRIVRVASLNSIPASGMTRQLTILRSVDLPAPDSPTKRQNSPLGTTGDASSTRRGRHGARGVLESGVAPA